MQCKYFPGSQWKGSLLELSHGMLHCFVSSLCWFQRSPSGSNVCGCFCPGWLQLFLSLLFMQGTSASGSTFLPLFLNRLCFSCKSAARRGSRALKQLSLWTAPTVSSGRSCATPLPDQFYSSCIVIYAFCKTEQKDLGSSGHQCYIYALCHWCACYRNRQSCRVNGGWLCSLLVASDPPGQ